MAVPKSTCTQAIPPTVAAALAWTLEHVITAGTATSANPHDGTPILAKTGTTDSYQQNWLVTSSSKVANAIWVGQISGSHDLRSYDYNGTELAYSKFYADRLILTALDAAYGGSEFATPPSSLLYGSSKSSTQSGNGNSGGNNGGTSGGNNGGNGGGNGGSSTNSPAPAPTTSPLPVPTSTGLPSSGG